MGGETVFAATGGATFDADLPVIVFVHGSGANRTVWALPARYFAHHGYSVLAVDLPGHGRSTGEPLTSIETMADWLVSVLDAAGVEAASVVGHSMGSLVALDLAARHPDRVRSIALLGAAAEMPVSDALLDAEDDLAARLIVSWAHGDSGHFGGQKSAGSWVIGGALQLLREADPGVLNTDLAACNEWSGREHAPTVKAPALVICGQRDRMARAAAGRELAELLPDSRCEVMPAAGHMMHTEKPDETLALLRSFL